MIYSKTKHRSNFLPTQNSTLKYKKCTFSYLILKKEIKYNMTSKVWIKMKLLAYVKCLRHISVCKILSSFTLFWEQSRRTKSRWYANVQRYKIWYGAYINVKIGVMQKYLHSDRKCWIWFKRCCIKRGGQ